MFYSTQVSCAGISSLAVSGTKELPLGVTHLLSYSYLPHRCPGHTLHLWSPPQPEGVAKSRGRKPPRRAEKLVTRPINTSYCSHLWANCPLLGCNWPLPVLTEVFDPSRFAPDSPRHSHSFLPFSGGARWDPVYDDGIYCGEYLQHTLVLVSCLYDISRYFPIGGYGRRRSLLRMCLCTKGG